MDCRPADRIKPRYADGLAPTRAARELVGWRMSWPVAGPGRGRERALAVGLSAPAYHLPNAAAALQAAFAALTGLMAGAESVGDPIAVGGNADHVRIEVEQHQPYRA